MKNHLAIIVFVALLPLSCKLFAEPKLTVTQITRGPNHHFFGYIGQQLCTPWNQSERYILSLRSSFHDHMPDPKDAADIVLIDTQNDYAVIPIEQTRAWNFQQGTMMYWHPKHPETQFFFNDRDPKTQQVYTVLYDIKQKKRVREYKFDDVYVANGGVAPNGDFFLAINYGRMARNRPVTGYPKAIDTTAKETAPKNDGIFRIDIESGRKSLIVSFADLEKLVIDRANVKKGETDFFINHSLCSRDSKHVYFYARARLGKKSMKVNQPCSVKVDGSQLKMHEYIGGHPEMGFWQRNYRSKR